MFFYSLVAKGRPLSEAKQKSSDRGWGARADFNAFGIPPHIHLKRLEPKDRGDYVCEVIYKTRPSAYYYSTLTVIGK